MTDDRPIAPLDDDRRERRHLPLIGLALSALYGAGLVVYLVVQRQNPADLALNELGFFQQSREIRLSGKALELQAREMRRSVDEHRALAEGGERAD